MELQHPYGQDNQKIIVHPPPISIPEGSDSILAKAAGVDYILAAKIINYTEYVYAVFGDYKCWVKKNQLDGMYWTITGEPVIVPDEFFWTDAPINPYFFLYREIMISDNSTQVFAKQNIAGFK